MSKEDVPIILVSVAAILGVFFLSKQGSTMSVFDTGISFPVIPDELKIAGIVLVAVLILVAFIYPKN